MAKDGEPWSAKEREAHRVSHIPSHEIGKFNTFKQTNITPQIKEVLTKHGSSFTIRIPDKE